MCTVRFSASLPSTNVLSLHAQAATILLLIQALLLRRRLFCRLIPALRRILLLIRRRGRGRRNRRDHMHRLPGVRSGRQHRLRIELRSRLPTERIVHVSRAVGLCSTRAAIAAGADMAIALYDGGVRCG